MTGYEARGKAKVVVAMSGGVDSSVTAALLLEEGYDVIGVTMRLFKCDIKKNLPDHAADAQKTADLLGIPLYVIDFCATFQETIIRYFTSEYLRGRTPNPCVACNREIKFGALLQKAGELGGDYMATGHYVRLVHDSTTGRHLLYRAEDISKDQSYVLYNLTQSQLSRLVFPLGSRHKKQIREKARALGLSVAEKKESQEICFIPDHDYKTFVADRTDPAQIRPGFFVNSSGHVLGRHRGLPYYTVGQRKGLGLALGYPAYVLAFDTKNNTVIVGKEEELYQKGLFSVKNNFIVMDTLDDDLEVQAKIRYGAEPAPAVISPAEGGRIRVLFHTPQRAITPGQSVVFYRDDLLVGGGVIDEVMAKST